MPVLPRSDDTVRRSDEPRPGTAEVTGTYWAGGVALPFRGTYRLERLLRLHGQPAASGVFSGRLLRPSDGGAGVASRRQTTAVEVLDQDGGTRVRVGPVDVRLLGLTVAVDDFTVALPLWIVTDLTAGPGGPAATGFRRLYAVDGRQHDDSAGSA